MRDITVYPITLEEVQETLERQRDKIGDDTQVGGVDGLCIAYLMNYLESAAVQRDMRAFLEEVQPKPRVLARLEKTGNDK